MDSPVQTVEEHPQEHEDAESPGSALEFPSPTPESCSMPLPPSNLSELANSEGESAFVSSEDSYIYESKSATDSPYPALEGPTLSFSLNEEPLTGSPVDDPDSPPEIKYRLYKRRWLALLALILNNVMIQVLWISFAPITKITMTFFDVSAFWVNALSMVFMLTYIPMSFVAAYVLDKGLFYGVMVAVGLVVLGSWLRFMGCLVEVRLFWLVFIGHAIAGLSQSFIQNAPTKLSVMYFGKNERNVATMLAALSFLIGIALGQVLPPFLVTEGPQLGTFNLVLACVATAVCAFTLLLIRNKPPSPPTPVAHAEKLGFGWASIKQIFRNRSFVLLLVAFGIGMGAFEAVTTLVAQIVTPAGYSDDEAGILGALMIGGGLIFAVFVTVALEKTRRFKAVLVSMVLCFTASLLAWIIAVEFGGIYPLLCVLSFLAGGFCCPVLPVSLEYGAELTYPIAEAVSSGLLMMSGNLWGVVLIALMGGIHWALGTGTHARSMLAVDIGMIAVLAVGAVLACFVGTRYRRLEAERAQSTEGPVQEKESLEMISGVPMASGSARPSLEGDRAAVRAAVEQEMNMV